MDSDALQTKVSRWMKGRASMMINFQIGMNGSAWMECAADGRAADRSGQMDGGDSPRADVHGVRILYPSDIKIDIGVLTVQ